MPLIPLNRSVFGTPIVRDQFQELASEVLELAQRFEDESGRVVDSLGARNLAAGLAPERVPYQIRVTAVSENCQDVRVGDLAFLPVGGGTMVTANRGGKAERIYMIAEDRILAVYREDDV